MILVKIQSACIDRRSDKEEGITIILQTLSNVVTEKMHKQSVHKSNDMSRTNPADLIWLQKRSVLYT